MTTNTNESTSSISINTTVNAKSSGDLITADTFRNMVTVLESLVDHQHTFYDDYTTVCECECQCASNRGTL